MNNFKQLFYYMIGRVPEDLHNLDIKGKKLLHISDTPSSFFGELKRIIEIIKPDYIVHTGDLVDNIKLELFPGSIDRYERNVKQLAMLLEQSAAEGLYLALGNHDDIEIVRRYFKRSHIIEDFQTINIEGIEIAITHYPEQIQTKPAAYNLYGHDLTIRSGFYNGRLYLNGISSINLIELDSQEFHSFPYPSGTDNERLGRGKIGL